MIAANAQPGSRRASRIPLVACMVFVIACGGAYGIGGWAPAHSGSAYIALHLMLTAAMLAAWATGDDRHARLTMLAGLAARVILIAAPMVSSNDAERYLWDGAVALAGFDPYTTAPADPRVAGLRAIWPTPPEHAAYPTLYPPGALALFALSALAGPVTGIWLWKVLASVAGVATLCVAERLLRRRGMLRHLPLVALSPILVLETGVGAHLDAFVALAIAAALLAFDARRPSTVGVILGIGVTIKLLPGMALIALMLAAGRRDAGRMALAAAAAIAALYGTALALGLRPVGSLPVFFEKWRNGSPLFALFEANLTTIQTIAAIVVIAVVLLALAARWARPGPAVAVQFALAVPLLLSPVVFPWYLAALVPAMAVAPSALLIAWLTASPLIYEVRDAFVSTGVWMPATWPLQAIAAAWGIGLAIDALRRTRAPRRMPGPD